MNCAIHTQTPAVAYCRTCGKALCDNCKRDVMGAIYCETCIAAHLQTATPAGRPVTVVSGGPSPGVAAWLGMIPGVGAMYNGQFIKALIHVVIFALLIFLADQAHGGLEPLFGMMIAFFWFYMVFEAYKTAKARQMGLPAPDPLGLDRMFGIHEDHPPATAVPSAEAGQASVPTTAHPPTGAIILIGVGVLFLLNNLRIFRMGRLWPIFLIALGLWIAYQRTAERP